MGVVIAGNIGMLIRRRGGGRGGGQKGKAIQEIPVRQKAGASCWSTPDSRDASKLYSTSFRNKLSLSCLPACLPYKELQQEIQACLEAARGP